MKYIIVDLEMNPVSKEYKEEKKSCKNEIIQIGAVALDEDYRPVGEFVTFVKPQYNHCITKKIVRLTKISSDMVEGAPFFEEALHSFLTWCIGFQDEVQIHQWSETDHRQITKEIDMKKVKLSGKEEEIVFSWVDFQEEFGKVLGLTRKISLKDAIMYAAIDMKGYHHNALYDARNTAELFAMVRRPDLNKTALGNVIDALKPKALTNTLGDLFNFQELAVSV